jgi:hypothetical protein
MEEEAVDVEVTKARTVALPIPRLEQEHQHPRKWRWSPLNQSNKLSTTPKTVRKTIASDDTMVKSTAAAPSE